MVLHNSEEAVAEELLPYKEFLDLWLYLDKIIRQLLHLVFVFTPAGQSCYDERRLIRLPRRRILLQRCRTLLPTLLPTGRSRLQT